MSWKYFDTQGIDGTQEVYAIVHSDAVQVILRVGDGERNAQVLLDPEAAVLLGYALRNAAGRIRVNRIAAES